VVEDVARQYAAARSAWLQSAQQRLHDDNRLVAALLVGSLGRGAGDDWSDVDLIAVVAPDDAIGLIAERERFVGGLGNALFIFDSPWNAPEDGAQVNTIYDVGCGWPLYLDCDLWPLSRAAIPDDVRVLFDRVSLPSMGLSLDEYRSWPTGPRPESTDEAVVRRARIAMIPIIAKCIVRHDTDRAERMLTNLGYPASVGSTPTERLRAMWSLLRATTSVPLAEAFDTTLEIVELATAGGSA